MFCQDTFSPAAQKHFGTSTFSIDFQQGVSDYHQLFFSEDGAIFEYLPENTPLQVKVLHSKS